MVTRGWRIHCGVEVTELSTNKQHTLWDSVMNNFLFEKWTQGGSIGLALLWSEKKKEKNYAVFCFAGKRILYVYIYTHTHTHTHTFALLRAPHRKAAQAIRFRGTSHRRSHGVAPWWQLLHLPIVRSECPTTFIFIEKWVPCSMKRQFPTNHMSAFPNKRQHLAALAQNEEIIMMIINK